MNYLAAESLIKQRLIDKMPSFTSRNVLSAADLEGVKTRSQVHPALHVLYMPDDVLTDKGSSAGNGRSQKIKQNWMVVVVVRNVNQVSAESSRENAGELITQVLKSMQGWSCSKEHTPFHRVRSPYKVTYRDGFAYFPFQFSTNIATLGDG